MISNIKESLIMKKIFLNLGLIFIYQAILLSQPQYFKFASNTGDSYSIIADSASIDGSTLALGSEIGIFTPAGLCVGAVVWTGTTPLALTAWADDSQTPNIDGYVTGDFMAFKIWDSGTNNEYDAVANYKQGNGKFGTGAFAEIALSVISVTTESITVLSPNGGEYWEEGTQHEIKWTCTNFSGQVKIEYSTDGNATHIDIETSTDNDGSYTWNIPNTPSVNCVIIISDVTDGQPFDISNAVFTISVDQSSNLIVKNSLDSGPGSLRDAINFANLNPGLDTIKFNIPDTVAGYNPVKGFWTIEPKSQLPIITAPVLIDGYSQEKFIGDDRNLLGPEIYINGINAGQYMNGLKINSSGVHIFGLAVGNFYSTGIMLSNAEDCGIYGCYIGTAPTGDQPAANGYGIIIDVNCNFIEIVPADSLPNIISGNTNAGIIVQDSSKSITIAGNIIGLDRTLSGGITNGNYGGIRTGYECSNINIFDNWIGMNHWGIFIIGSNNVHIQNNYIGTVIKGEKYHVLGNEEAGIYLCEGAHDNFILENNIQFNTVGVYVYDTNTVKNKISHNCIARNISSGIILDQGGNSFILPPVITNINSSLITGTSLPHASVEVYTDSANQGIKFLGETNADGFGNFQLSINPEQVLKNVTALQIDTDGNTSGFSLPAVVGIDGSKNYFLPSCFELYQNYPNPFNPVTRISFAIPQTNFVTLKVYDILGKEVAILVNEEKQPGTYFINFNAVNLSSGVYLYRMTAGSFSSTKKFVLLH